VIGSVIAYGRTWPSAAAVVEAETRVRECRCVECGQDLTGRWVAVLVEAQTRAFALEAELAALRSGGRS
jgi:hypothetical protein